MSTPGSGAGQHTGVAGLQIVEEELTAARRARIAAADAAERRQ